MKLIPDLEHYADRALAYPPVNGRGLPSRNTPVHARPYSCPHRLVRIHIFQLRANQRAFCPTTACEESLDGAGVSNPHRCGPLLPLHLRAEQATMKRERRAFHDCLLVGLEGTRARGVLRVLYVGLDGDRKRMFIL